MLGKLSHKNFKESYPSENKNENRSDKGTPDHRCKPVLRVEKPREKKRPTGGDCSLLAHAFDGDSEISCGLRCTAKAVIRSAAAVAERDR